MPSAKLGLAARLRGAGMIALASGVAYALPSLAVAAFVGPELTVVVGSLCSLLVTAMLARRQKTVAPEFEMHVDAAERVTPRRALRAWSCFILIFVLLLLTSKLVPAGQRLARSVLERRHDL